MIDQELIKQIISYYVGRIWAWTKICLKIIIIISIILSLKCGNPNYLK